MTIAAAVSYGIAFVAELSGIALVVTEGRRAQAALRRWRDANPNNNPDGAFGQQLELNGVMEHLLGSQANRRAAVALLVLGVVAGTLGNYLSLSW
jgi:hypothetical protein